MIRINLAKSVAMGKGAATVESADGMDLDSKEIQRQGLVRVFILLIFPLLLYLYEFQNIPELQAQLNTKNTLLRSLTEKNEQAKGAVSEIRKFKEDQSRLQQQIDTLEGLQKERLREVKILDNLQKDIPEKVWLTRMEFVDTQLRISGLATAEIELTIFMENLTKSVFLKEVNLIKSQEQPSEQGLLRYFEIVCVIDRPAVNPEVKR